MVNSRTKNSVLTMITSGIRQFLTLTLTFASRTVFIYTLGAEYLGLNGLFLNILSLLALSELGIGTAIAFYLYKPLAENDMERIKALMHFYKMCYRYVGLAILIIGCCLIPVLPKIVNLEQSLPDNLYLVYIIYLFNSASSYLFFAYKQALVTANQEQYKIEKINIIFTIVNCIVDILVLLVFRNYIVFLLFKLLLVIVKNILIAIKIDREYPYLKGGGVQELKRMEIRGFFKDIYSVSLFSIGSVLFNSTTNIVISLILGTVVVGYYSNYYMIISQVSLIFGLITRSFTAGIGNVMAKDTKERQYTIYKKLDFMTFIVFGLFTVCLYQLSNPFMNIWLGGVDKNYILGQSIVTLMCINFFIDCSAQTINSFRIASGNFKIGQYQQIIGGGVNIILSVVLAKYFGLFGVLLSSIICKMCVTLFPFVLLVGHRVIGSSYKELSYSYINKMLTTTVLIVIVDSVCHIFPFNDSSILSFVIKCFVTLLLSVMLFYIRYRKSSEIRFFLNKIQRK